MAQRCELTKLHNNVYDIIWTIESSFKIFKKTTNCFHGKPKVLI